MTVEFTGHAGVGKSHLVAGVSSALEAKGLSTSLRTSSYGPFDSGYGKRKYSGLMARVWLLYLGVNTESPKYGKVLRLITRAQLSGIRPECDVLIVDEGPFHDAFFSIAGRTGHNPKLLCLARYLVKRSWLRPDLLVHVVAEPETLLNQRLNRGRDARDKSTNLDAVKRSIGQTEALWPCVERLANEIGCEILVVDNTMHTRSDNTHVIVQAIADRLCMGTPSSGNQRVGA